MVRTSSVCIVFSLSEAGAPQEDFAEADAQEYHKHKPREFSVRVDMLNWLLLGRFRVELEATVWKFISVQLVPVFVTTAADPAGRVLVLPMVTVAATPGCPCTPLDPAAPAVESDRQTRSGIVACTTKRYSPAGRLL